MSSPYLGNAVKVPRILLLLSGSRIRALPPNDDTD